METRDHSKCIRYKRCSNKVIRAVIRKIQRTKEKEVAELPKDRPQKFWRFIKSNLKTITKLQT